MNADEGWPRERRRWAISGVLVTCVAVVAVSVGVRVLFMGADPRESSDSAADPTSTTADALPVLECPDDIFAHDQGAETLASGAVAARLCGGGHGMVAAPIDTLSTGLESLVAAVNTQPTGDDGCYGPIGDHYLMLLAYPGDTLRHVNLSFSGCGSIAVGSVSRLNPDEPFETFMSLIKRQRRHAEPPATTAIPVCLRDDTSSSLARPSGMIDALLCVTYAETMSGAPAGSVRIDADDLTTLLTDWQGLPDESGAKTDGCSPVTPSWTISGVTAWGDRVSIEAECGIYTPGCDSCRPGPEAQRIIDRLVREAGFPHPTVSARTSAYYVAAAYIDLVNFGFRDDAAALWAEDAWLPPAGQLLDWNLQEVHPTTVTGWQRARTMGAYYYEGGVKRWVQFTVARNSGDDPWRIVRLER